MGCRSCLPSSGFVNGGVRKPEDFDVVSVGIRPPIQLSSIRYDGHLPHERTFRLKAEATGDEIDVIPSRA
jgi:hypothetical protein